MLKKSVIVILVLSLLLLTSCGKIARTPNYGGGVVTVEEYMSNLTAERKAPLSTQLGLLAHPLKDAVALYGDDYEFSWEGNYVTLKFKEAKCSVGAFIGLEFVIENAYTSYIDYDYCEVMEYLSYAVIERISFEGDGVKLTDGISIGMSTSQICEILNAEKIEYSTSSSYTVSDYDENGKKVKALHIYGTAADTDYQIVFHDDILKQVEISNYDRYITDNSDGGRGMLADAFAYLSQNELGTFDINILAYNGNVYSPYFDSWFYGWKITDGDFKDYVVNVEKNAPHRIYISPSLTGQPIMFWRDGKYVEPTLSFLGKWREHDSKEYIDIKSISKEGVVIFDMYAYTDIYTGEMVLLENLNAAFNEMPKDIIDYLRFEYNDESLMGDIQLFNGEVQSGYYTYAGQKYYLIDSFIMDLNGRVEYLPRSLTGRIGAGPLTIHLPANDVSYEQASTFGYMESFGRDDPDASNTVKNSTAGGASVINEYLNGLYETSGLKYADLKYTYLHDYTFPVNNKTYHVWQSKDADSPHYLYVDAAGETLIRECVFNSISKHTKELIYKANTVVSGKSYVNQKYVSLDGKITVDLTKRTINKTDSFVENIEIEDIGLDTVGINERFMFFANIGNSFALNGYVLFDHTTWGATLHITDSNIPEFDIGVYYLNSETFFLDPSIGVVGIDKDSKDNKYLDDKTEESGNKTTLVIRSFGGQIIGYIHVDERGKKTVKNFQGRILGYYNPDRDVTTDFSGKIVARGDAASALLFTTP